MRPLLYKPNLLYLIFVRQCYKLIYWLRPLHRNKLIKAITIYKVAPERTDWYIKPYDHLIKHRDDGPAEIYSNGALYWYKNGKMHREDGPAIIRLDGMQEWYINGKRHCDNGPALITSNGVQCWYKNGKIHREDGPAYIHPNGTHEWWLHHVKVDPF